ncbi:nucleotidyltransferase family protein [Fodinicola acaciae]|uniref:nucleotidyltransferase family protein n=1 Tax=Fodinicola acaciae TaxID=2681555 RepID=UPI001FED26B8|nr:nucleotidyltransferase family protein [Fodinicola acaciae]
MRRPSPQVAGLLLAAGAGRRFGMPKALVEHRGSLLVESAARVLADGGCAPVYVVVGAAADEVQAKADLGDARVVVNDDWPTGMGSSLRRGLEAVTKQVDTVVDAVVILPVDTPGVTAAAVRRVAGFATPRALAAASYDGVRGHPVLIGRDHWPGVRETAVGDRGARDYLKAHTVAEVPCEDIAVGTDADRPEDLPT